MEYRPPQRDFLNEAFVLFETRGQTTMDEAVLDREYPQTFPNQLGQDAALTMGTIMRDPKGGLCSLYQPELAVPPVAAQGAMGKQTGVKEERSEGSAVHPREPSSNSGSDVDWEPDIPALRHRSSNEDGKLRVRERGKPTQRKWRQKYKERQGEQAHRVAELERQVAVLQREKGEVEAHADILERALMKMSMEKAQVQTDATPIFIPSLGWTSFDPRGSVVLCVVFDEPRKLTAKQAASITLRDHAKLWTQYVVKARELIGQADASKGPDCPHLVKLKALLMERHGFLAWTAANNPSIIHRLTTCNLECDPPKPRAAAASPQHYADLLVKLELTPEQSAALVESRSIYLLNIGFHSAKLARLQSQVMALDPTPKESLRNSSYVKWADMSRALQEAVEDIHLCHVRLHFDLYHGPQALSAYQAGLLLVLSYPYLPDMIALVRELASSHNAPSSEELLTKGAMRYAEKQGAADIQVSCEPSVPIVEKMADLIQRVKLWEDSAAGET